MIIDTIKNILKLSPVPLSKNHRYDILTRRIIKKMSHNSNCIDIGCFKGEILDIMLDAAPAGQHFGIEPIPQQYAFLKDKYSTRSNCNIINIAASNEKGTSTFNYVTSNPSYSGLKKRDYDKPDEIDTKIEVSTDLIDDVIPDDIQVDLIKIDVEGAEMLVLEGASQIIERDKPIVIFEHGLGASDHYGTEPGHIYDFFLERSMQISTLRNYLKNKAFFSREEFEQQYEQRINYYFIAYAS